MDWITSEIAIGNIEDAMNWDGLRLAGIRSVLSLNDFPNLAASGLDWRQIRLIDGAGNPPEALAAALMALRELAALRPKVLVHCQEGKSRSAAVVALYLATEQAISLADACALVQHRRPETAIEPALLEGLGGALLLGKVSPLTTPLRTSHQQQAADSGPD